jgi:hypothetical protein
VPNCRVRSGMVHFFQTIFFTKPSQNAQPLRAGMKGILFPEYLF